MTAKVLVSDELSERGLEILRSAPAVQVDHRPGLTEAELCQIIGSYDALVIRSGTKVTAKVLELASKLKVIGRAGIGVDNVDVPAASRRGVVVMNTPTGNAVTTAEHALTLLLSAARKIPQATASMRAGKWEKKKFEGREVTAKTLGIIGLGNIGRIVADRALGLKMVVIAFDPVITADRAASLGVELVRLSDLFARADFITVHTPVTPQTKGLLDDSAFAQMKVGVIVVNAARGGIVDEAALLRAIATGKVAGAALDVFEKEPPDVKDPLLANDAIILTPHLGASTSEAQERVALEIAEQVVDYLGAGIIKHAVNVPSLSPEIAKRVEPYQRLARRLGRLLGQLGLSEATEFRVSCTGEANQLGAAPLVNDALAGFLERYFTERVNAVSAPIFAEERGITVVQARENAGSRYASTIGVTISGKKGTVTATGALGGDGSPHLVELDGCDIDALLDGTAIVSRNDDRPGVIGAFGTILGNHKINVSRVQLGLDAKSRQALAIWNVDSKVGDDAVNELKKVPAVSSVLCVDL